MAKSNIHVGLEIGTTKICAVVGDLRPDGSIKILGVGTAPSRGVRKGEIVDFDAAQICLHEALIRAEDRSDVMIKKVFLAFTGPHIQGKNSHGEISIATNQTEITEEDMDEVKEKACDVSIPQENISIHRIPRHYYVDGKEKVTNPLGMLANRLDADFHIVHGVRTRVQNAIRCLREFPLEVEDVVFSPIAAAQVMLNHEAREQGCLLLDIGGGTTDYVLFDDGSIYHSGSIGIGGDQVTSDISIVLKIPPSQAERLKIDHGSCELLPPDREETIQVDGDGSFDGKSVDRGMLIEVIRSRMEETFQMLKKNLRAGGALGRISGGIYLCGGSSLLPGIDQLAEEVFELPVRRSNFSPMSGLTSNFEMPQFATPVGLIRWAQRLERERQQAGPMAKFKSRMGSMFGVTRVVSAIFS
jgi:cell division protein FtsA